MGTPLFNPMTTIIIAVVIITVITLAIVLPLTLGSSSSDQNKTGYVPLLAPGRVQMRTN